MEPRNPNYREATLSIFRDANFVMDLGIEPVDMGPGWVESKLVVQPRHMQHDRVIHAGVQTTIADHTAGASAFTLIGADQLVLTTNLNVNLLKAAIGEELFCRAEVLRAGRTMVVSESEVFAVREGRRTLASKATVSLAVLTRRD